MLTSFLIGPRDRTGWATRLWSKRLGSVARLGGTSNAYKVGSVDAVQWVDLHDGSERLSAEDGRCTRRISARYDAV